MRECMLGLTALLALSLMACSGEAWLKAFPEEEKLCEAGDRRCKVGEVSCVVGYDGDCSWEQVCYAGEGAPKGTMGACTEGQLNAQGALVAVVVFQGFEQGERWVWPMSRSFHSSSRERFFGGVATDEVLLLPGWFGFGKAAAVLSVSVRGPRAEAEQLKVSVRGVEQEACVAKDSAPGWRLWECRFEEGWAGTHTREPLELRLWTESGKDFPWTGRFWVDTQPLELVLEARLEGPFLEVSVHKKAATPGGEAGAWLEEVHYFQLEVIRNGDEISTIVGAEGHISYPQPSQADHRIEFAHVQPTDTFEVRATVSARDWADNEALRQVLTARLAY